MSVSFYLVDSNHTCNLRQNWFCFVTDLSFFQKTKMQELTRAQILLFSELGPGEGEKKLKLEKQLKSTTSTPRHHFKVNAVPWWHFCFSIEGTNFRSVLDKAVQADGQVKECYQSQRDTIALLCKPEPELNAAIPSANPAKTMQGSEVRRCFLIWVVISLGKLFKPHYTSRSANFILVASIEKCRHKLKLLYLK